MEPLIMEPTVLTADAIAHLADQQLDTLDGISHRILWRSDTSMAGVLHVAGGHRLGTHSHRRNEHHMWVLNGQAIVLGHVVSAGSYIHVPSGVDHDIDASASAGCTVYYLYLLPG